MIKTELLYYDFDKSKRAKNGIIDKSMLYEDLMRLKDKFQTDEYYYGVILDQGKQDLCIGFCEEEWVLIMTIGTNVDVQYHSKGDISRNGFSEIFWMNMNGISDKSLVPKDKAWEAVQYWLDTGELSPVIEWSDELLF